MKRQVKVIVTFVVDSDLIDKALNNAVDSEMEGALDRLIDEGKINDYDYSSKKVEVRRIK